MQALRRQKELEEEISDAIAESNELKILTSIVKTSKEKETTNKFFHSLTQNSKLTTQN